MHRSLKDPIIAYSRSANMFGAGNTDNRVATSASSSALPSISTCPFTAIMAESSDAMDGDKLHQLFDQEDSGLGSMNGYLSTASSIDLGGRGLDSINLSEDLLHNSNKQLLEANSPQHIQTQQEFGGSGYSNRTSMLSLTSGLSNLNLAISDNEAYRDTASQNADTFCPDNARLNALQKAYEARKHNEECRSGLSSRDDSGLFSINTSSSSATADIDGATETTALNCLVVQQEEGLKEPVKHVQGDVRDSLSSSASTNFHSKSDQACRDKQKKVEVSAEQRVALYQGDADGDNWLHLTIINGREDLAMTVIKLAPDYIWLSFSNLLRQTPLHLAVLTAQPRLVRRLVCAGAMVDAQDKHGDTPLHIACRLGHADTVTCLLKPVCYEETLENSWEIPYQLLPQNMVVTNADGQTPLHLAVVCGHEAVVRLLLDAGADPNRGDAKSGRTSLHLAAESGRLELVQLLASRNESDWTRTDYAGHSASQLAVGRGLETIHSFLRTGDAEDADLSDADSEMTLVDSDSDSEWREEGML